MSRNSDLAKIHIGASQLGMIRTGDDSAYRDMLWTIGRVRSSKDLDSHGRQRVIDHLKSCGFKIKRKGVPKKSCPQTRLVRSLWLQLRDLGELRDASEASLRNWAAAQLEEFSGVNVVKPIDLLTNDDRNLLIERLKLWHKRVELKVLRALWMKFVSLDGTFKQSDRSLIEWLCKGEGIADASLYLQTKTLEQLRPMVDFDVVVKRLKQAIVDHQGVSKSKHVNIA